MSTETRDAADAYALAHIDEWETTWIAEHLRKFAAAENAKLREALADAIDALKGPPMSGALFAKRMSSYTAALSTAPQPESGDGWQPIETAPKDGTHFLAVECGGVMYRAAWHSDGYLYAFCGQPVVYNPTPTHWRPLPAPPTT